MTRRTSIEAYHKIKEEGLLSKRRWQVYDALYEHGPCTANELDKKFNLPELANKNIVTRLGELRDFGVAYEVEERPCSVTGQRVIVWDVTEGLPIVPEKPERPTRQQLESDLGKYRYVLRQVWRQYPETRLFIEQELRMYKDGEKVAAHLSRRKAEKKDEGRAAPSN